MTVMDKERWALLDDAGLSTQISFMMRLAQLALLEHVFSEQKNIDLSFSQLTIMRLIHTRPELTQQRIADAMRIKKTNLTPLINELAADGLVSRKSAATNRKAYALHLTRKGQRALDKAMEKLGAQMNPMTDIIDPEERAQLISTLRKIVLGLPPRSALEKTLKENEL